MNRVREVIGKVFKHPKTGEEYGVIRSAEKDGNLPNEICNGELLATDECGNYFIIDSKSCIHFWDHETNYQTYLAKDLEEFLKYCVESEPLDSVNVKVESVWIDPEFAKMHGLDKIHQK